VLSAVAQRASGQNAESGSERSPNTAEPTPHERGAFLDCDREVARHPHRQIALFGAELAGIPASVAQRRETGAGGLARAKIGSDLALEHVKPRANVL